jgi:hypothetical protein
MKFAEPRRPNPFDNPLVAVLAHLCAMVALAGACYSALVGHTLVPLWVFLGALALVEGAWLYFRLRR